MRVLNVISSCTMGGAEMYVSRILPMLRNRGIEVELYVLDRGGPLRQKYESSGIPMHWSVWERRREQSHTLIAIRTVREISQIVAQGNFDVVHSYLYWSDVLGMTGAYLAACPRRIISRRALHSWMYDTRRPIQRALEALSTICATELIANSQAVLADAESNGKLLPKTRTVIYNGIDATDYPLAQIQMTGTFRMVCVGALHSRKGQEFAVRALQRVRAKGLDAKLTLVGQGPDEAMLRELAGSEVGRSVEFAGLVMDPRAALASADIFILPSRQEGFSNALLEAMACGLPAIATNVGGNAEAIEHGVGGHIVPPEDVEAIADSILEVSADRSALITMGEANRERVRRAFSLEASADRLAEWYQRRPTPDEHSESTGIIGVPDQRQ